MDINQFTKSEFHFATNLQYDLPLDITSSGTPVYLIVTK